MLGLNKVQKFAVALVLVAVNGIANAALPTGVEATFTGMSGDFTTLFGYAFTAMSVVVSAMIAWRYVKKLGNKI